MDTITLDQEKFKTAQELASLNLALLAGQGELAKLRAEEEQYMQAREKKVLTHIAILLKESEQALQDISFNHDLLQSYTTEVRAFNDSVKGLHVDLLTTIDLFNEHARLTEEALSVRERTLKEEQKQLGAQKLLFQADIKAVQTDRKELEKEKVLLKDRQDTLKRGFEELRRKQL